MNSNIKGKTLVELKALWATLGDIPVSEGTAELEADAIEEQFLHFPVGTNREDIWHWFEAQNSEFSVAKMMGA